MNAIDFSSYFTLRVFILLFSIGVGGCNESPDPRAITLLPRKPQRVGTCHIFMDTVYDDRLPTGAKRRTAFMQTACDVPETALDKQWWGEGMPPPGFSLDVGDCMPLDNVYYCLENVVHNESATFRPMYLKPEHPKGALRRLR